MSIRLPVRVLVSSPTVPPDVIGQAVVLDRMFKDVDPTDYQYVAFHPPWTTAVADIDRPMAKVHRLETTWRLDSSATGYPLAFIRSNRQFVSEMIRRSRRLREVISDENIGALLITSSSTPDPAAALVAARLARVPLIVHMMDEWRETLVPFDRWLDPIATFLQARLLTNAAGVIVANRELGQSLDRRYGTRSEVIPHPLASAALLATQPQPDTWPTHPGDIRLVYTGQIYAANMDALERIVDAVRSPRLTGVSVHLYSQGPAAQELVERGDGAVILHQMVAPERTLDIQRNADVLIMPLAFSSPYPEAIRTAAPTKYAEYLASSRPILIHAPSDSFPVTFARTEDIGEVVDTPDTSHLIDAIARIIEDPQRRSERQQRGRRVAEANFSEAATTQLFTATLISMLAPPTEEVR